MSPITTHILDTANGTPAAGVPVLLEVEEEGGWREIARGTTNADGRLADWMQEGSVDAGTYQITFDTLSYFQSVGHRAFYPVVRIAFAVHAAGEHYHVPLLLSPFGYSTYRGS